MLRRRTSAAAAGEHDPCDERVEAKRGFVVMPEGQRFPMSTTVEAIALPEPVNELATLL